MLPEFLVLANVCTINIVQVALEDIKSSDLTALHPAVILKNEDGQPIITGRVLWCKTYFFIIVQPHSLDLFVQAKLSVDILENQKIIAFC